MKKYKEGELIESAKNLVEIEIEHDDIKNFAIEIAGIIGGLRGTTHSVLADYGKPDRFVALFDLQCGFKAKEESKLYVEGDLYTEVYNKLCARPIEIENLHEFGAEMAHIAALLKNTVRNMMEVICEPNDAGRAKAELERLLIKAEKAEKGISAECMSVN